MTKDLNVFLGTLTNAVSLNFLKDDNGNYADRADCVEVGWRLLNYAAMLPWGRFIGW